MGKLTKRVRKHKNSKKNKRVKGGGSGSFGGKQNKTKPKTRKNKRKVNGGSPHLESLPLRYYYPLNDHSSQISDVSSTASSSEQFYGGKNKKNKKKNKSKKQIKGGGMMDAIFNGPQLNVATGFGTTVGARMAYEVQTLEQPRMADILNQPAGDLNNDHSPLLV